MLWGTGKEGIGMEESVRSEQESVRGSSDKVSDKDSSVGVDIDTSSLDSFLSFGTHSRLCESAVL